MGAPLGGPKSPVAFGAASESSGAHSAATRASACEARSKPAILVRAFISVLPRSPMHKVHLGCTLFLGQGKTLDERQTDSLLVAVAPMACRRRDPRGAGL